MYKMYAVSVCYMVQSMQEIEQIFHFDRLSVQIVSKATELRIMI